MTVNILIADDEKEIADLVELYLKNEGYGVFKAYSGAQAEEIIGREDISLALLDVMLPDTDGFALLCRIRERYTFPVIMLTAKTGDMDKITGLTLGADDYITKPFNPLEVAARVKTQLRRRNLYDGGNSGREELCLGGLFICRDSRKCSLNGENLNLTPIEFDILWYLCKNRGRVVSSEELFEAVWKEKFFESDNTVMAHIARLREKMHEPSRKPKYIKTVWGVGYTVE